MGGGDFIKTITAPFTAGVSLFTEDVVKPVGSAIESTAKGITGQTATKAMKEAAESADIRAKQAAKEMADAQSSAASQAQEAINERRRRAISGSQSIYTSPLGISGTANISRKYLLGQ